MAVRTEHAEIQKALDQRKAEEVRAVVDWRKQRLCPLYGLEMGEELAVKLRHDEFGRLMQLVEGGRKGANTGKGRAACPPEVALRIVGPEFMEAAR